MAYFVTGATGFIGRFLVANLLKRGEPIYVLVRKSSLKKLAALREAWGADDKQVIAIVGDLAKPNLGVARCGPAKAQGQDQAHRSTSRRSTTSSASAEAQQVANVDGTRHAVEFAARDRGRLLPSRELDRRGRTLRRRIPRGHVRGSRRPRPSVLPHQARCRRHRAAANASGRAAIYRPGFVVGHSKTGYIDKIDGPYYFFKLIQKMRKLLPPWMPTIGIEGGRINIVPVDFVADALDYLAHKKGLDGKCFHLTDPEPYRIGEVLNIFAQAAHAPQMTMRINARMFGFIPAPILYGIGSLSPVKRDGPRGAQGSRHPEGRVPVHQLADALRQPRGGQGAQGLRASTCRRSRRYAAEAVGLLGAQPRPGPLHRPQPVRGASRTRSSSSPARRPASAARPRSSSPRPAPR